MFRNIILSVFRVLSVAACMFAVFSLMGYVHFSVHHYLFVFYATIYLSALLGYFNPGLQCICCSKFLTYTFNYVHLGWHAEVNICWYSKHVSFQKILGFVTLCCCTSSVLKSFNYSGYCYCYCFYFVQVLIQK